MSTSAGKNGCLKSLVIAGQKSKTPASFLKCNSSNILLAFNVLSPARVPQVFRPGKRLSCKLIDMVATAGIQRKDP